MHRAASVGWQLILPVGLLVSWWVWSASAQELFFPPLRDILRTFGDTWFGSGFAEHILPSLTNFAIGYAGGVLLGVLVGVAIGLIRRLDDATSAIREYLRALPPPAILPFAILLLGVGPEMKVGVIAFGVFFPVLMNTVDGVRALEPTLSDMSRVYSLPWSYRIRYVLLPSASPQIVAGCRTALSLGILLMVVSEMVASTQGIGYFTLHAQRSFAFTEMWAGILLLALLGYLLNLAFGLIERRVLHWQIGAARAAT